MSIIAISSANWSGLSYVGRGLPNWMILARSVTAARMLDHTVMRGCMQYGRVVVLVDHDAVEADLLRQSVLGQPLPIQAAPLDGVEELVREQHRGEPRGQPFVLGVGAHRLLGEVTEEHVSSSLDGHGNAGHETGHVPGQHRRLLHVDGVATAGDDLEPGLRYELGVLLRAGPRHDPIAFRRHHQGRQVHVRQERRQPTVVHVRLPRHPGGHLAVQVPRHQEVVGEVGAVDGFVGLLVFECAAHVLGVRHQDLVEDPPVPGQEPRRCHQDQAGQQLRAHGAQLRGHPSPEPAPDQGHLPEILGA